METIRLFTLTDKFMLDRFVEKWESLIWTERYSQWGDFELHLKSDPAVKRLLPVGTYLALSHSKYIMQVETVQDSHDDQGNKVVIFSGRDLVKILDDRIAMPAIASLTATPTWNLTGTPGDILNGLFTTICIAHSINSGDGIPNFTNGRLLPHGAIPEPSDIITVNLNPDSLYNSIKLIADTFNLGFRIVCDFHTGFVYFEIYTGEDRTSDQEDNAAIIFGESFDNFEDVSTLQSNAGAKNVAYVFAQNAAAVVYAPTADSSVAGAARQAMIVDASDIDTAAGPALNAQLQQRGLQELSKLQTVYQFDGQMTTGSSFIYGVDYNLGDIVEERDDSGNGNQMRVTEQIFVSDQEGDRSYPTLTLALVITPGSWAAWDANQTWADVPITTHWSDI